MKTLLLLSSLFILMACRDDSTTSIHQNADASADRFDWQIPASIPLPVTNDENPMSEAKFALGRHLFYDQRLSGNGTLSCSSCHQQDKAFTDGRPTGIGSTGQVLLRNTQTLTNVAYNASYTWANASLLKIEQQLFIPLFNDNPVEHGINSTNWPEIVLRLKAEPRYDLLFKQAFPGTTELYTQAQVIQAIAVFVRGITSFDSAYDRHLAGDDSGYSAEAKRGETLFFSERMECFHCHGGYNFSDSTADRTMNFVNRPFHNTGLYNLDGQGKFPSGNGGLFEQTGKAGDMGRFRAPTLRNIAKTAPYMHDGSIPDLPSVLDFYAAGGRNIASGANAGDGRKNPYKDGFVTGFVLTEQDKKDLLAFLESLTDNTFVTNPRYSNPWQ